MTKTLHKIIGIAAAIAMTTALTACGDDDDEPKTPTQPATVASYKAVYTVECSADVYKYFDVEVTYTDSDGSTKTETVTGPFNKTVTINAASAPSKAVLKAEGTPKTDYPAIDPEGAYQIDRTYTFSLYALTATGELVTSETIHDISYMELTGDVLTRWMEAGRILNICDRSINLNK